MRKMFSLFLVLFTAAALTGCLEESQEAKDRRVVERQQAQYAKSQPVPVFDWSLERELLIQLYRIRNRTVATHSVWRSNTGMVEGDCPSMGYGLPYDTSLTNPLRSTNEDENGYDIAGALTSIGQPEPNGIFASTNTSATWVFCVGDGGVLEPVYVESKVTVYPYPVKVDYTTNRVTRAGKATVIIPRMHRTPAPVQPQN